VCAKEAPCLVVQVEAYLAAGHLRSRGKWSGSSSGALCLLWPC
jgi:hypothetical protein